jgi:hypothetical protein
MSRFSFSFSISILVSQISVKTGRTIGWCILTNGSIAAASNQAENRRLARCVVASNKLAMKPGHVTMQHICRFAVVL